MIYAGNTFSDYFKNINEKKIIIYGAGKFLNMIVENYPELFPADKISFVIDKNNYNRNILICNKNVPVLSIHDLLNSDLNDKVLLIACRLDISEVLKELNSYSELNKLSYFILPLMLSEHVDDIYIYHENNRINKIPKKIHFFWFSGTPKDDFSLKCLESWRKFCSDYEIIEWNQNNYDITKNPFMYDAIKAKKWAYAADYARIDILNEYGGIYLDLDVELYSNLDALLNNNFFIGFGPIRDIEAAAFGSIPKHDILLQMLKIYENLEFPDNPKDLVVQPVYLNRLFKTKGISIDGKYQSKNDITVYPRNVFSSRNWFTGELPFDSSSVGVHHCKGGWISQEQKLKQLKSMEDIKKIKKELL